MRKHTILIGLLALLAATGTAQTDTNTNVDTVILASTSNFPDAMISAPVSNKLGYPVLLTDQDELSESAASSLNEMNPENVIIVGGPSVISEEVETEASSYGNVTRLWGTTQVGTSIEVAEYFWSEGSEEAVIVQYPLGDNSYHPLMGAVKNEADERPVLISKEGTLSASVLTAVEDLGVQEAEVFSTNAVNVTQDLEASGVSDVEMHEGDRDMLQQQLRDTATVQDRDELVIVAAGNFRDTISVPNNPNSASYIVSSEDQISGAIALVVEADEETRIKVVGNPQLAQNIVSQIEDETGRDVDEVSGQPDVVAARQARERRADWQRIQEQRAQQWRQNANQNMMDRANQSLHRAERAVDENSSQESQRHLRMAQEAFENGDYFQARRLAVAARSSARVMAFRDLDQEEIRERVREDQEDFKEAAEEIRENNQEMAEELREAETREERMEIIREYREERMDILEDRRREARENLRELVGERRERRERDRPNMTSTRLRVELDENEFEADAWFVGRTGGFTVAKSLNVQSGNIVGDFNFLPPNGPATQALTEYRSEMERNLDSGTYEVNIRLRHNGIIRERIQRTITVPGEARFESRTNGIGAGRNSRDLDSDDDGLDDGTEEEEPENEEESESESEETEDSDSTTITYTDSGFSPSTVTVSQGDEVEWVDESDENSMWVASDRHPSHEDYSGTSRREHCSDDSRTDPFDQCESGDDFEFEFDQTGEWDYHNHDFARHGGTVVVE